MLDAGLNPQQENHYIIIPRYIGEVESKDRYIITDKARTSSLKSIFTSVDLLFSEYLDNNLTPDEVMHWKAVVASCPLSEVLKTHFSDSVIPTSCKPFFGSGFDFQSSEVLTPNQLVDVLYKLSRVGDLACEVYERQIVRGRGSPLQQAMKIIFKDDAAEDGSLDQLTVERFFNYLIKDYFFTRSESADEILQAERIVTEMQFITNVNMLLNLAIGCALPSSEEVSRVMFISKLLVLVQNPQETEKLDFLDAIELFSADQGNFLEQAEALLVSCAPRISRLVFSEQKFGIAEFSGFKAILPLDNFYFIVLEGEEHSNEWGKFPDDGAFVGAKHTVDRDTLVGGHFDISVFDPDGFKVFWGDLLLSQITGIKGPFYVLSQSDSYHQIPKSSTLDTGESRDSYREQLSQSDELPSATFFNKNFDSEVSNKAKPEANRIDPLYMRAKALGAICNGKFIPNNMTIPNLS